MSPPASKANPLARSLSIGIDARATTEVQAGRGRVVRELLRALALMPDSHRYICFARRAWEQPLDERFEWRIIDLPDPLWHFVTAQAAARDCDIFLSTNSYLTAMLNPGRSVVIIYDLVTFDRRIASKRSSVLIERLTLGSAVRRAVSLICVSDATAASLRSRYPFADHVTVAHLGIASLREVAEVPRTKALPKSGFVLAVGTLEPRKNLPRLVAAYASLPRDLQEAHPLVVVGADGWRMGKTSEALDSLGDRCIRLGKVSDAMLGELYRRCVVFCFPSLAEGFGLPVLEAMAAGAPVLTSNVSSLPEVGGDAVAYVDPWNTEEISQQLRELHENDGLRARIAERGPRRSAMFSWVDFAEQVRSVLEAGAIS